MLKQAQVQNYLYQKSEYLRDFRHSFPFLFGMGNSRQPVVFVLAYLSTVNVSNLHCGPEI